ncbi:transcription factor S [Candidatus Pacearchaeota archaeon]|nr:transcription factor S [Candidatus Pacearchaeota archaeon]
MEFCPKCGAILMSGGKGSKCPRCSYSSKEKVKVIISEKINDKKEITVVKEKDSEVRPIVKEDCEKCKNKHAYFWTVQTRAGDEAETKFFKCTKCNHTWREYR